MATLVAVPPGAAHAQDNSGPASSTVTSADGGWTIERVSLAHDGSASDGWSNQAAISSDGSQVAFASDATNLRTEPPPPMDWYAQHIYVRDLPTGVNTLASSSSMSDTDAPSLDRNGSYVAFSAALQGSAGWPDHAPTHVFVQDVDAGAAVRAPGDRATEPTLSDDGQRVAYKNATAMWVFELAQEADAEHVSVNVSGDASVESGTMSADGSTLAYVAPGSGELELRVHDLTDLAAPGPAEIIPTDEITEYAVALSGDGRLVAYHSEAPEAGSGIHVYDRVAGTDALVVPMHPWSVVEGLVLSDDGSTLAYYEQKWGDSEDETPEELWVTDVASGVGELIVESSHFWSEMSVDLSADGNALAFSTIVDVLPEEDDQIADVFVARRADGDAPTWGDGATLRASRISSSLVTLEWDAAADDVGVTRYRIERDGTPVAEVGGTTTSYTVSGLSPDTAYDFAVFAADAAGNWSAALAATITTASAETSPGTGVLLVSAEPGGVAELTWDSSTAGDTSGYRVHRATGNDSFAPVADVGAGATTYTDSGLAASTTYRYRVTRLQADGGETPHTADAQVTTPDLTIGSVAWTSALVGPLDARDAVLGEDIRLTVTGERGRLATVDIAHLTWFDTDGTTLLAEPRQDTTTVELVEDEGAPGTYRGSHVIPEGMAKVTGIVGEIADGAGHRVRKPTTTTVVRLPVDVRGAIGVTIDAPAGSIPGGRVTAVSASTRTGAQTPIEGGGEYVVAPLVPQVDYAVSVLDRDGVKRGEAAAEVRAGLTAPVTIRPVLPATLTALVLDDSGLPKSGAKVTFRDVADGAYLGYGTTGVDGRVAATARLVRDQQVEVVARLHPSETYISVATATTRLEPDGNVVELRLQPLGSGAITGTVTDYDGTPAYPATISVRQQVDGRSWSFSTQTDENGVYEAAALPGHARFSVGYANDPPADATLQIPADGTVTHDVTLPEPVQYQVGVRLLTKYAGDTEWREQPLDWRVAVHFRLRAEWTGGSFQPRSSPFPLTGAPGDEVKICADGVEAGLGKACETLVLGESKRPTIDLRLAYGGEAVARLFDADGARYTGSYKTVLTRLLPDGTWEPATFRYVQGHNLRMALHGPGTYELTVRASSGRARTVRFTLPEAVEHDLGQLRLGTTGPFSGEGSGVLALTETVVAGGVGELRTTFRNDGPDVTNAVVRLGVPAGTTLVDDSVTLNGEPIVGTPVDDGYAVPVGDVPANGTGVLRHRLSFADTRPGTAVTVASTVDYDGRSTPEVLGSDVIEVAAVTLVAPADVAIRDVVLSGRAPADTAVVVRDGRIVLGEAMSTPGGFWSLRVSLPDLGTLSDHELWAETAVGDELVRSESQLVHVDVRRPHLSEVVMRQPDGREVRMNPSGGVAHFPYVFWPGAGISLTGRFTGQGRVDATEFGLGDLTTSASRAPDGEWRAAFRPSSHQLGDILIRYDSTPGPIEFHPTASQGQLAQRLPRSLQDATQTSMIANELPDGSGGSASASYIFGADMTMNANVAWQRNVEYNETSADLERRARTGIPIYGLSMSPSMTDRSDGSVDVRISASFYVPEDAFPAGAWGTSTSLSAMSAQTSGVQFASTAAATSPRKVSKRIETAYNIASGAAGVEMLLNESKLWQRLQRLLPIVQELEECDPQGAAFLRDRITDEGKGLVINELLKGSYTWVSAKLPVPAQAALEFLSYLAVSDLDETTDAAIKDIEERVRQYARGCDELKRLGWKPVARPTWIHDPSGFVFEAVESNRVEGVTATLLERGTGSSAGDPGVWDATWYGQENPLVTDADGRYGWDVPEGWWQVAYAKDGYELAFSDALEVLPPHFDVNVGIVSLAAPEVTGAQAWGGSDSAVEITFDKYMHTSLVDLGLVSVSAATPVSGTVEAVDVEQSPTGASLARTFRFRPAEPLTAGEELVVRVDDMAMSYADRPMLEPVEQTLTVAQGPAGTPPPTAATEPLAMTKTADRASAPPGGTVTYTISVRNPNGTPVSLTEVTDTLPQGFRYRAGTTAGAFSTDPSIDGRTLRWAGPITVPPRGTVSLRFGVAVATAPGTYANHAGGSAREVGVTGTGPTAEVTVDPRDRTPPAKRPSRERVVGDEPTPVGSHDQPTRMERISGVDRFATAAALSRETFADRVPVVYIATGERPPDALAAGAAAAAAQAPLLLTRRDSLPQVTTAELRRLEPAAIVVVGGSAAIGAEVEAELHEYVVPRVPLASGVRRIAGPDRFSTAAAVSAHAFPHGAPVAHVASGDAFPDAVTAVPPAAGAGGPILLVGPHSFSGAVQEELARLGLRKVVVVGGQAAVAEPLARAAGRAAGAPVERIAGTDRFQTAVALAEASSTAEVSTVYVATGERFPDALAAGPMAAMQEAPILLVGRDYLPDPVRRFLDRHRPGRVVVVGGPASISDETAAALSG